jgi:hypothetical protein
MAAAAGPPGEMASFGGAGGGGPLAAAQQVLQSASVDPMLLQTAHGTDLITSGLAKYNGEIRYDEYRRNLRLLADKVLTRDQQALLLSILNTSQARMQDPSAAPNVVGITWDKVQFTGAEAVVLLAASKTSAGVHTQLMDTPILPLYEWIFTLDDYLGSCWAQVNRCIQHIKAVRRQANGVRSNEVQVDQRGFLEPMLMSQGDIDQLSVQIPPPDFCLWDFRNELRNSESRRYVSVSGEGKLDRLTGLGGLIDKRQRNMTYVEDSKTYTEKMAPSDDARYGLGQKKALGTAGTGRQGLFPKTPYQRCIEEAVDLSFEQVNTCRALEQGLFRVHFMPVNKLHAGAEKQTLSDFLLQSLTYFIAGPAFKPYKELPAPQKTTADPSTGLVLKKVTFGKDSSGNPVGGYVKVLSRDAKDGASTVPCEQGMWCNAFDHDYVSADLLGCGVLQPKPQNWAAYGNNHVRKQWENWTLSPNAKFARGTDDILLLPRQGGAISNFFATTLPSVSVVPATKLRHTQLGASATATRIIKGWFYTTKEEVKLSSLNDPLLAAFPYPASSTDGYSGEDKAASKVATPGFDESGGTLSHLVLVDEGYEQAAKAVPSTDELDLSVSKLTDRNLREGPNRVTAVELSDAIIWERMKEMKKFNHPIQHCAVIGEALKDLRLNDWIKEHFLYQLIRIFNEVRNAEMAQVQVSCPTGTDPYPMMRGANGELVAVPIRQAMTIDPSTGQMVFDPRVAADVTRCVLPGLQQEPPPVPGIANAPLGAEYGQGSK